MKSIIKWLNEEWAFIKDVLTAIRRLAKGSHWKCGTPLIPREEEMTDEEDGKELEEHKQMPKYNKDRGNKLKVDYPELFGKLYDE